MTRVAFVDAPAGLAGDMFLGALVDAGLPVDVLEDAVRGMALDRVELRVDRVQRGALTATKVDVCRDGRPIEGAHDAHAHDPDRHHHGHRDLKGVLHVLGHLGDLEAQPLSQAAAAFRALAEAEARVHGTTPDEVHFHEVGAADALVDIVGTCIGLHHLGVDEVRVSPLPWNRGTVETAHGTMPLPAPATAYLLEGHPSVPSEESYEQVTPTGAALVRTLSAGSEIPAGFVPKAGGLGAGTYDKSRLPNVLRVVLGEVPEETAQATVVLIETNLDDASGQVVGRAIERVLSEGALDAWCTPITMKKGRPGVVLSVLARPADVADLEAVLFRETPTLGTRRRVLERTELTRRHETVETEFGAVRVKVRETPDGPEATPEYEDCRALADEKDVPLRRILDAARRVWERD